MSLKPRKYTTSQERAARVLAIHGRAPATLRGMDAAEVSALAALCDESGNLVDGGASTFRATLRAYYDRHKATDEALDEPTECVPVAEAACSEPIDDPTDLDDDAPTLPADSE
jgi:hypothetical protein